MDDKDKRTCEGMEEERRVRPLRPYTKRGMWAGGVVLIVVGAVSFYLFSLRSSGPALKVVGGNPVSVGEWPCGQNVATGITLKNDSGRDVVLDHMVVY